MQRKRGGGGREGGIAANEEVKGKDRGTEGEGMG